MKLVTEVKLLAAVDALATTLTVCNQAANWVSHQAWEQRTFAPWKLRSLVYRQVKQQFGLSAQPALHVIKKVAEAYTRDHKVRRSFRKDAAQPYDDRCLSWQLEQGTVSIWTVHGRIRNVPFACGPLQRELLAYRKGETDLVLRDGSLYLLATCEVPEAVLQAPTGMLGVDLGLVNIATTSTGTRYSGKRVNRVRYRSQRLRTKLQKKGTKSAKRLLKKRARKESRFATDVNHRISKRIVTEAQRTGCGITLEDLTGVRDRVRLRKPQRVMLHSWSFHQLGTFIGYKARRAGVLVVTVDPAYTSQQCSRCGHIDRANRTNQAMFECRRCGFAEHADVNAAANLKARGWAAVNQPDADPPPAASEAA